MNACLSRSETDWPYIQMVDYPNQARLKILGRAQVLDLASHVELAERLRPPSYKATLERALVIEVEAYDWNCPQHITPRWTALEIQEAVSPLKARIAELESELEKLKRV